MKVVEIREEAELTKLRSGWEQLLCNSASNTIFLSWEWVSAWWAIYGTPGELRILAAYDESGVLRGIAPLRRQSMRRYGQTVEALTFVGDGSNDSDYLDFMVAAGYEAPVMAAFGRHWAGDLDRGTILALNEIPATSPNLPLLKEVAVGRLWTESDVPCGTVRLPATWEEYLAMLQPRFRTKVRSVLRNLECRGEVRFGFCESAAEIERRLPNLFDLHTRRWAQQAKPGVFGWDRKREFYAGVSPLLLDRGWLRFSWLEWNGQVLACQYGFAYGDTYSQLQEGYEPAAEHWNVGVGLRAWSIREFLKQGLREYDFLGGFGRHKSDWGAEIKHSKKILAASSSWRNVLFCHRPEWETSARESVAKLLPEKVLAARRKRFEQRRIAAFAAQNGRNPEAPQREWARKALAGCYVHSQLPALLRPLRERYRLSLGGSSGVRGISCSRRTQPSAHILFYHRVNDDRDPFFPSMSTRLFEQEMRYIARNYNVVPLSELMDRLVEGSPESVLAITFDDGYQDNYHNAFPVLERYGLPATIFLATDSIDTREALWFERLSDALKTTARDFVDLEIDLPRRFWLRNEAERLEANARIFSMLRTVPDSARRQLLTDILRQLAVDKGGRNGKMLSWDQVRRMREKGIDFGGHTVTHPFISKLTRDQAGWEISECKRRIEEELQQPVRYFAYPSGREEDFGGPNKELIQSAGYRAAVTTIWGTNSPATDPLELRRGGPWEETAALFASKLDWYQFVE